MHGYLSSWNCLIDRNFTLKVGKLGFMQLKSLMMGRNNDKRTVYQQWVAPEILDSTQVPSSASDIFALGIILIHIILQKEPTSTGAKIS